METVRMPKLGQTMEAGIVAEWLVGEGDAVEAGETIAIIESEKSSVDLEAAQSGTLARIDLEAGVEIPTGTVIAILLGPDESLEDAPDPAADQASDADSSRADGAAPSGGDTAGPDEAAAEESTGAGEKTSAIQPADDSSASPAVATAGDETGRQFARPAVRRRARAAGISLSDIEGTGTSGIITDADVRAAVGDSTGANRPAEPVHSTTDSAPRSDRSDVDPGDVPVVERREQSPMRRTIADRMSHSHRTAPHVTLNRDVRVDAAFAVADELSSDEDTRIGFTDLLVGAAATALETHPEFNAWFRDDGLDILGDVNVAVAVDTDAGLVTPVIREVTDRTIGDIARERRRLTTAVLDGDYSPDDLQGGTFTITNLGMFGITSFDPIINPPQVAILGVGTVRDTDDGQTCVLSLSFDHRAVDGADAARFLSTLVAALQSPSKLVLEQARGATASGEHATQEGSRPSVETSTGDSAGVVHESIATAIAARLPDLADRHGMDLGSYTIDVVAGDDLTIEIEAEGDISPANLKRLGYAAARAVGQENSLPTLFDPAVTVAVRSAL